MFGACDLGEVFSKPDDWNTSSRKFVAAHGGDGFVPADASGRIVNCLGRGQCEWKGIPLWEARVYFREGGEGVQRVEMSLYNRGDAARTSERTMTHTKLEELVGKATKAIDPSGKPPVPERVHNRTGGYQLLRKWPKLNPAAELAWGYAEDKSADYVRLALVPRADDGRAGKRPPTAGELQKTMKANVTRAPNGDVWTANVPMVDQGQKGYCAVAVSERVLRYYGREVDEHQVAQMAGSTAEGGTNTDSMREAVKTIGGKFRLGFSDIISLTSGGQGEVKRDIDAYNRAAKQLGRPQLRYEDFLMGMVFRMDRLGDAQEPDVLLAMRKKDPRRVKFLKSAKELTDRGIPIFWGVTLGKFPEPDIPQASGGHMRLIIGYNQKTHEILYTDSWGAGHELKRMDEDKAFAITHDAFYLRPL